MDFISWEYLKEKGNTFFREKKYEEALKYYEKAIFINDRIEVLYSNKGTCEKCLQNYSQAILDYKKAITLNPLNAKNFNRLASVYLIVGDFFEAYGMQKKAIKIDPNNTSYKEQLDTINKMIDEGEQIEELDKQNNYDEIDKKYQNLIEKWPEFIYLKRNYILFLFKYLKYKEAREFIKDLFSSGKIKRNNPEFGFLSALLLYYIGDYKNAEILVKELKRDSLYPTEKCNDLLYKIQNIELVKQKGNELYNQKKYEDAIKAYTKALEFDPQHKKYNSLILVNRALCYEKIKKYYEALNDSNLSVKLNPNYARGYIKRANIYIQLKNFKAAIDDYDKAKKVDPSAPGIENYLKEINRNVANLESDLNTERQLKQKLCKEIISLKNVINIKDKIIKDKTKEIEELNRKKKEKQSIIISQSNYESKKDKIIELMQKLEIKEDLIKKMDNEIKGMKTRYPFELYNDEKLMIVTIETQDRITHHSFLCKNTHKFTYLENLLYEVYPELTETENYYLAQGKKINKYKTLEENNIKDNDIIILNKIDDEEDNLNSSFTSQSSYTSKKCFMSKESFGSLSRSNSEFFGFQIDNPKINTNPNNGK